MVATGSMDSTAKLWDVSKGAELCSLMGHTAEIVSLNFNTDGDKIITGSFDHTTKVWDVHTGEEFLALPSCARDNAFIILAAFACMIVRQPVGVCLSCIC